MNTLGKPFALGVTLSSLMVTTTDQNWLPHINQDMTSMIYKVCKKLKIQGVRKALTFELVKINKGTSRHINMISVGGSASDNPF